MSLEHGYVLTHQETLVLMYGAGLRELRGLPLEVSELDSEEEMSAVRSLIHKEILTLEGESYRILDPVRGAVFGLREAESSVKLYSKEYPGLMYVCFRAGDGLSVWEFDSNVPGRVVLHLTGSQELAASLEEDGFIPKLKEFCSMVPEGYEEDVAESVRTLIDTGEAQRPRIVFLAVRVTGGDREYLAVSSGRYGNIISRLGKEQSSSPYTPKALTRALTALTEHNDSKEEEP